jgi:hypothetical protein
MYHHHLVKNILHRYISTSEYFSMYIKLEKIVASTILSVNLELIIALLDTFLVLFAFSFISHISYMHLCIACSHPQHLIQFQY